MLTPQKAREILGAIEILRASEWFRIKECLTLASQGTTNDYVSSKAHEQAASFQSVLATALEANIELLADLSGEN